MRECIRRELHMDVDCEDKMGASFRKQSLRDDAPSPTLPRLRKGGS
jgi:hypothetical protein